VCYVFTDCLVTASNAVAPSASVFHCFTSSLAALYLTVNTAFLSNDLKTIKLLRFQRLHQRRLSNNSLRLGLSLDFSLTSRLGPTGWCFDSPDIASARTKQKTPCLCWCGWRGIPWSAVAALSAWHRTAWQHRLPQLSYYCVTSPQTRTWRVPLLRVSEAVITWPGSRGNVFTVITSQRPSLLTSAAMPQCI
jgi:hypothetical protein